MFFINKVKIWYSSSQRSWMDYCNYPI